MNDEPLFQNTDELEKTYAPQQLPPDSEEQKRVLADEGGGAIDPSLANEPPSPAPVANVGSSPSSVAAPPNIGHEEHGGAPGDPNTQARDPMDAHDDAISDT
jgi:hypothetical protein